MADWIGALVAVNRFQLVLSCSNPSATVTVCTIPTVSACVECASQLHHPDSSLGAQRAMEECTGAVRNANNVHTDRRVETLS